MPGYAFQITLVGEGDTPDKAWRDATEAFQIDPGPTPDEYTMIQEDKDGNEITETSDGTYSG